MVGGVCCEEMVVLVAEPHHSTFPAPVPALSQVAHPTITLEPAVQLEPVIDADVDVVLATPAPPGVEALNEAPGIAVRM